MLFLFPCWLVGFIVVFLLVCLCILFALNMKTFTAFNLFICKFIMENKRFEVKQSASNNSAWEPLTKELLNSSLTLANEGSRSLQMLLKTVSAILGFTVEIDRDENIVILRQTGVSDCWDRLNAKVSVGYEKIVKIEGVPRFQRICIKCASLSALRQALQDVQETRIKSRFFKTSVKPDLEALPPGILPQQSWFSTLFGVAYE